MRLLLGEGDKGLDEKRPNNGIHRSARCEFCIVPPVPLARPVMPSVRQQKGGPHGRS
jgi:hypothetical protein